MSAARRLRWPMGSKVRGVGYTVGAARRLHYRARSHRRRDGDSG
jgi:hypothetical protein